MPETERCAVDGCRDNAYVEVILYDVYPTEQTVFFEQDHTCPFLCKAHMIENEKSAEGTRKPRGSVDYRYSNQGGAQGFTIYRPLKK